MRPPRSPTVPGLGRWLMAEDARVCLARCEKLGVPVVIRRLELGPARSPTFGRIHEITPVQLREEHSRVGPPTET